MRWGAGVLATVCLVAVACSDRSPETVDAALLDGGADVFIPESDRVGSQPSGVELRAAAVHADKDVLRFRAVWDGDAPAGMHSHLIVLRAWKDGKAKVPLFTVFSTPGTVYACADSEPEAFCSEEVDDGTSTWDAGAVTVTVPRKALPKVTGKTRWAVARSVQENANIQSSWTDVVPDETGRAIKEPPPAAAISVAPITGADLGDSGIGFAAMALSKEGRRLVLQDGPPDGIVVRVFEPGAAEPFYRFEFRGIGPDGDVDEETFWGSPGLPDIPDRFEWQVETSAGSTRRVATLRP